MSKFSKYRVRRTVEAREVQDVETLVTETGAREVQPGSYVVQYTVPGPPVIGPDGTLVDSERVVVEVLDAESFASTYESVGSKPAPAKKTAAKPAKKAAAPQKRSLPTPKKR